MNLSEVGMIADEQDIGRWLDLMDPVEGKPVGIRLLIAGPDSKTQNRARLRHGDELVDARDDEGRISAETHENLRLRLLARCVINWEATEDGQPVPFGFEAMLRLLRAGRWVQEVVDDFAASRAPYRKGKA